MLTKDQIKAALEHGHKASSVLRDVLQDLMKNSHCFNSDIFGTSKSELHCGECVVCIAKFIYDDHHDWKCTSAGVWESYYECEKCGDCAVDNHDDTNELPVDGCNV